MSTAEATPFTYDDSIESALTDIGNLLGGYYGLSKRAMGLLLLQGDQEIERKVRKQEGSAYRAIQSIVSQARAGYSQPLSYIITLRRQQEARRILSAAVASRQSTSRGFAEGLSRAMMNPILGSLILLA
ncbi:MAG: ferrous iron transporter B, partial [Chloroflexi bacterium]|nr:ferrous iron transporter B [Chloroflexota bacterium]